MSTAPRSRTTDKRYYGVAEGIVTDNLDPQNEGRVRVEFPWFDDHMITEWCRVLQPYAGNGYGVAFVPEVGDEVIVAFTQGDMRLPIILGGVHNGKDKPPTSRTKARDEKLIRTKAGHQVLLNDSDKKHQIEIRTAGGHTADLNDQAKQVSVKTTGGHQVVLDDQANSVTVKTSGGQTIVLDGAKGSVTITGASITLDGQSIKLGGAAAIEPLILGQTFLTMFNTHVHTCAVPGSPTTPPVPPIVPAAVLSRVAKTS